MHQIIFLTHMKRIQHVLSLNWHSCQTMTYLVKFYGCQNSTHLMTLHWWIHPQLPLLLSLSYHLSHTIILHLRINNQKLPTNNNRSMKRIYGVIREKIAQFFSNAWISWKKVLNQQSSHQKKDPEMEITFRDNVKEVYQNTRRGSDNREQGITFFCLRLLLF